MQYRRHFNPLRLSDRLWGSRPGETAKRLTPEAPEQFRLLYAVFYDVLFPYCQTRALSLASKKIIWWSERAIEQLSPMDTHAPLDWKPATGARISPDEVGCGADFIATRRRAGTVSISICPESALRAVLMNVVRLEGPKVTNMLLRKIHLLPLLDFGRDLASLRSRGVTQV